METDIMIKLCGNHSFTASMWDIRHMIILRLLQVIPSAEQDMPYENLVIEIINDTDSTADSLMVCCDTFVFGIFCFVES